MAQRQPNVVNVRNGPSRGSSRSISSSRSRSRSRSPSAARESPDKPSLWLAAPAAPLNPAPWGELEPASSPFGAAPSKGSCVGVVVKIADDTVIGKIAQLALSTEAEQTPINKEIHHFIQIISAIAFALGISFFAAALGMGQDAVTSLVFMIGIIVANVPEGLLATVTVCLTLTAKRMYTKKVMVKNLEGVETLGSTSCICSDKTGTLTQNIMTVAQVVYDTNGQPKIQDAGSSFTKGISTYDNESAGFKALVKCSTLCNTCNFDKSTNADFAGCTGVTKRGTAYNKGTFCNGGYKLDASGNPVAKGEAGCSAFDGATANLFYCEGACDVNCPAVTPAQIAAGKGPNGGEIKQCQNVASRMVQKNALMHSQAAYWVSIVVVQWADLLICKTRWLSIKQQGLRNSVLNFGLFFETLLAAWLCYGGVFSVLGTQPIRFTHWMPGVPWSMMIFMYDETRKYMMRATSPEVVDAVTGAVQRQAGWIEKSTYY